MTSRYDPITGELLPESNAPINANGATTTQSATIPAPIDAGAYEPEAIKTKITERLVQELHDRSVKGMPLYKLCAELLDRIEGKPVQRIATKDMTENAPKKAAAARSERIAKFLGIEFKG